MNKKKGALFCRTQEESNELADKLTRNLKTRQNVSEMTRMLAKVAMERILALEMEEHPDEEKKATSTWELKSTAVHCPSGTESR